MIEETVGSGDSTGHGNVKTCACGTITKTFDIDGCITVTESIDKEVHEGSINCDATDSY